MSVVVRMEMPNGCHDCKLRNMIGNCPIPIFDGQDEEKIWTLAECFQRPPWCPIICSLPKGHGRLVDADALIGSMLERKQPLVGADSSKDRYRYMQWFADFNAIKDLKTVVPAERSDTEQV